MIPIGDDDSGRTTTPWVTYILIALNVIVFFVEITQPSEAQLQGFFEKWAVVPLEYAQKADLPPQAPGPFWITLFTSMFLHGGWMHLIGNMLYLWIFGDNVEDRWGHGKYLLVYLISGLVASLAHIVFNLSSKIPSLGASGAIAGILGAYLVLFPKNRIRILSRMGVVHVPAIVVLGFWIVLQILSQASAAGEATGVAYWAHIGGFLAGVIFAFLFGRRNVRTMRPAM
jgi:membrane associated rhomboid family serine protease